MAGSASSAGVVVPLVLSLVPARSVCDVGCGAVIGYARLWRMALTILWVSMVLT
jgi:hypothetical protein